MYALKMKEEELKNKVAKDFFKILTRLKLSAILIFASNKKKIFLMMKKISIKSLIATRFYGLKQRRATKKIFMRASFSSF